MRWLKRTGQVVILVAAGNFFMGILMLMDLGASHAGICVWLAVLFAALVGKHKKSPRSIARPWVSFYAREGTRTPKDKPHAPQTCASASSATLAQL